MSKTHVPEDFRNVRVDPDKAHIFCYTVRGQEVIDFRLTFGWSRFLGVMSATAAHAHCNTTIDQAQLLDEGNK